MDSRCFWGAPAPLDHQRRQGWPWVSLLVEAPPIRTLSEGFCAPLGDVSGELPGQQEPCCATCLWFFVFFSGSPVVLPGPSWFLSPPAVSSSPPVRGDLSSALSDQKAGGKGRRLAGMSWIRGAQRCLPGIERSLQPVPEQIM